MKRLILHILLSLTIMTAGFGLSACRPRTDGPNINKNATNGSKVEASPTVNNNNDESENNPAVDIETAMIFRVVNDVLLKTKGSSEFARIDGGLFHGGDELQVGQDATAWVSCADDRVCPLGHGLYTQCCQATCENEIPLKPPAGEPDRAFMKKNDLPPDELRLFQQSETKIRNLNANDVTTQYLIANLYSSWKLVEANKELDKLSQELKKPKAAQELNNLYAPMVRKTGDLYLKVDRTTRAEENYKKAVELAPRTDDPREKADARVTLGRFYEMSGQKEKAVVNLKEGEQLYERSGEARKAAATRRAITNLEKQR